MIHVLLAAWNEEVALPRLVKKFSQTFSDPLSYKLWVYDDGSSDKTREIAMELSNTYPVEVLWHEKNQGLGQTLIDGLNKLASLTKDDDLIITMDCDDTHEPQYLVQAIKKIHQGYDVVALSRFTAGAGQEGLAAYRAVLSCGAGIFLKILFPIKGVREYSCNFRVFTAKILKKAVRIFKSEFISLPHLGFVAAPEILIKFRMLKAKITESPFVLKYDQKPTPSTNRSLQTMKGYFVLVAKWWGRRAPKE